MFLKTFSVVGTASNHAVEHMMMYAGYSKVSEDLAKVIIFTGGVDVAPRLYKSAKNPETFSNNARDMADIIAWTRAAKKSDILKVGLCRGAQFLCVMNGGELWQDTDGHRGNIHPVNYLDEHGATVSTCVNSTHHQMMKPGGGIGVPGGCERWGWTYQATYRDEAISGKKKANYLLEGPDNEILYYSASKSLCFQPHPEYSHTETRKLFSACLSRAFNRATAGLIPEGAC